MPACSYHALGSGAQNEIRSLRPSLNLYSDVRGYWLCDGGREVLLGLFLPWRIPGDSRRNRSCNRGHHALSFACFEGSVVSSPGLDRQGFIRIVSLALSDF